MASRSRTLIAATGLLAAACGSSNATSERPDVAKTHPAVAVVTSPTRVDALLADANVALSGGDLLSARLFLTDALTLEPDNLLIGQRLAELGGGGPTTQPTPGPTRQALAASTRPRLLTFAELIRGSAAAAPAAPRPTVVASAGEVARDSVRTTAVSRSTRSARAAAAARRQRRAQLAAARDSMTFPAADSAAPAPKARHKRTWPWTRAQRWLVAKGVGGGAGAGVVIGAIVGNVPGALLAGSAAGGAVGFKKATKIGPAAPYPTKNETAEFEAKKDSTEAKQQADSAQRLESSASARKLSTEQLRALATQYP